MRFSISQLVLLCIFVSLSLSAETAFPAQDSVPSLDTITVVGSRVPRSLASSSRGIAVIDRSAIEASGAASLADLLETAAGIDIRERGAGGVQADLSLRGGTFEQALILLDGIPLTDPQTGHHHMDIPVTVDDIERIEVLSGQASRVYGPGAIGGVVNIVTREPRATSLLLRGTVGQNRVVGTSATAQLAGPKLSTRLSASRSMSGGYRYNTDADISTVNFRANSSIGESSAHLTVAYNEKDFGANGFYTDITDEQREHTRTVLSALDGAVPLGPFLLKPRATWRRHYDDFVLGDPAFYRNETQTDVVGGGVHVFMPWKLGTLSLGAEGTMERIISDDLGGHRRYRGGLFLEHPFELFERLTVAPGVCVSYVTGTDWQVWPGLDAGLDITDWLRVFGGVEYSFRTPTFTELYYDSPGNRGSSLLDNERTFSVEAGTRVHTQRLRGSLTLFRRDGRDVIDWARDTGASMWVAGNVDEVIASGGEADCRLSLTGPFAHRPIHLQAGYAFVDLARSADDFVAAYQAVSGDTTAPLLTYKYGTDYLRHKISAAIDHALLMDLRFNWRMRYERRHGTDLGAFVFDARMYANGTRGGFYVEVTNLFDRPYRDFASVPMPGRWVRGGLHLKLSREPGGGRHQ